MQLELIFPTAHGTCYTALINVLYGSYLYMFPSFPVYSEIHKNVLVFILTNLMLPKSIRVTWGNFLKINFSTLFLEILI